MNKEKETKLFIAIVGGFLLLIFICQFLKPSPPLEIKQVNPTICPNPITTSFILTGSGYGYLDIGQTITLPYVFNPATKTITICRWYKYYMPIMSKNANVPK